VLRSRSLGCGSAREFSGRGCRGGVAWQVHGESVE
jgi:hypothetical protein